MEQPTRRCGGGEHGTDMDHGGWPHKRVTRVKAMQGPGSLVWPFAGTPKPSGIWIGRLNVGKCKVHGHKAPIVMQT